MSKIKAVIVAEGCYKETIEFDTLEQLNWYSDGLSHGASLYGAGGCGCYTIEDLVEFKKNEPEYKIITKHLT